jgi:gamma-glutamylaminecyclotransferase
LTPIFVYGTLKSGFGNHGLISSSDFVDDAILENYNMVYSHGSHGFPVIYKNKKSHGHIVIGEVYVVDDYVLKNVDELESNGVMYKRKLVSVKLSDGSSMSVNVYIGINKFWDNYEGLQSVGRIVHNWKR